MRRTKKNRNFRNKKTKSYKRRLHNARPSLLAKAGMIADRSPVPMGIPVDHGEIPMGIPVAHGEIPMGIPVAHREIPMDMPLGLDPLFSQSHSPVRSASNNSEYYDALDFGNLDPSAKKNKTMTARANRFLSKGLTRARRAAAATAAWARPRAARAAEVAATGMVVIPLLVLFSLLGEETGGAVLEAAIEATATAAAASAPAVAAVAEAAEAAATAAAAAAARAGTVAAATAARAGTVAAATAATAAHVAAVGTVVVPVAVLVALLGEETASAVINSVLSYR